MITVAVLGATGYTALEALKILLRHPQAEIVAVTSRQEGNTPVSSVHPSLVGRLDLPLEDLTPEQVGSRAECVLSCLPHCASAEIIPRVLAAGAKVIDFSADYRLDDAATYIEGVTGVRLAADVPENRTVALRAGALMPVVRALRAPYRTLVPPSLRHRFHASMTRIGLYGSVEKQRLLKPGSDLERFLQMHYQRDFELYAAARQG
jgi:hypothetical protein